MTRGSSYGPRPAKPPLAKRIFVFGSNLAGRHGAGSALEAYRHHGAARGVGCGPTGNSYAIPTKDQKLQTLPLSQIALWIEKFLTYAETHKELQFDVVEVGCGLAGYTPQQIAPFFRGAPTNVALPKRFREIIYAVKPTTTLVTDPTHDD